MRVSKTNENEITEFLQLLNEINELSKDFSSGDDLSRINWQGYERLGELTKLSSDDSEIDVSKFLELLCDKISKQNYTRILFNTITLLENCANPDLDYLDYHPDIKAGLELLKNNKS